MHCVLPATAQAFKTVAHIMRDGGVIACPTESVFGLSCDPFNRDAVLKLLAIKSRDPQKGLLLVASQFEQLKDLLCLEGLDVHKINQALMTWPGPYTWVFPASSKAPRWITGRFSTIAVRVTHHPVVKSLCDNFGPMVTTSANSEGGEPAKNVHEVLEALPKGIDALIDAEVGTLSQPTQIRDVETGKIIRP